MEETTILVCDFAAGAVSVEQLAKRRQQWAKLFSVHDGRRQGEAAILLYRTPKDIAKYDHLWVVVVVVFCLKIRFRLGSTPFTQ